jgi:5-methylcytosine-specific restriction protein A
MIYSPADIKWFKSVKNVKNEPRGDAYIEHGQIFPLHVPNKHHGNLLKPKPGEIIVLYQVIDGIRSFTHLITPAGDKPLAPLNRPNFKYGRNVEMIAGTGLDSKIPLKNTLLKSVRLSGIINGNFCELKNVKGLKPATFLDEVRLDLWNHFLPFFTIGDAASAQTYQGVLNELATSGNDLSVREGKLKLVSHMIRERDPSIIRAKKKQALANGQLKCEVCAFSFPKKFGIDFIECHHIGPIADRGEGETKVEDLALVCSNCHRMLHRKFDGKYLLIEEMQKRFYAKQ